MDWEGVNEGGERTWSKQIKLHGSVPSCQPADREASVMHTYVRHYVQMMWFNYNNSARSYDGDSE